MAIKITKRTIYNEQYATFTRELKRRGYQIKGQVLGSCLCQVRFGGRLIFGLCMFKKCVARIDSGWQLPWASSDPKDNLGLQFPGAQAGTVDIQIYDLKKWLEIGELVVAGYKEMGYHTINVSL